MHLHGSLMRTAALYAQPILGIAADDVVYSAAKLFFAYGLGNALTFPLAVGATAVLLRRAPDARRGAAHDARRTGRRSSAACRRCSRRCSPIRRFARASPRCGSRRRPARRCRATSASAGATRIGSDILDGIGSTEMLHIFLSNRPGDIALRHDRPRRCPATSSSCAATTVARVADGDEGALWVRGPTAASATGTIARAASRRSTARGRAPAIATSATPTARGPTAAAPTTCSRSAASGSRRSRSSRALAAHPAVLEAAVVGARGRRRARSSRRRSSCCASRARPRDAPPSSRRSSRTALAPYKYPRWIELVDRAAEDGDRQDPALQAPAVVRA